MYKLRNMSQFSLKTAYSHTLPLLQAGALFFLLTALWQCASLRKEQVYKNFTGEKPIKEYALLKDKGFLFWMKDGEKRDKYRIVKKRYGILKLKPGAYLLGFVQVYPRMGGAAYCRLKPGRVYSFKITGKQYMPRSGVTAFQGSCFFDPEREENKKLGFKKGDK